MSQSTSHRYPVVEERTLARVQRRMLLGGRREPTELPAQPPGTVLVFDVGGRHEVLHDRRHLTGKEEEVVAAVAVSVVDVRERLVVVDVAVPSVSAADDFTVRVSFRCRVTRPDLVAAAGLTDLTAGLRGHLANDRELVSHCGSHRVEDINAVRRWVGARVTAYSQIRPPLIGGVSVELAEVEVLTPADLRQHATGVRDEKWRQLVNELQHASEDDNVARLEAILHRGPDALSALAISRGQENVAEAADRAFRIEAERRRDLLEVVKVLAEEHHLDTAPVDGMRFVDALADQTIGRVGRGAAAGAVGAGSDRRRLTADETPRPLDEEDL